MAAARETLQVAQECFEGNHYKDAINRSYYAAFYAVKAVLALEERDFKRHKDVVAYFNKEYVATEIFPRELGRKLGRLKQLREKSDYDKECIFNCNKRFKNLWLQFFLSQNQGLMRLFDKTVLK